MRPRRGMCCASHVWAVPHSLRFLPSGLQMDLMSPRPGATLQPSISGNADTCVGAGAYLALGTWACSPSRATL